MLKRITAAIFFAASVGMGVPVIAQDSETVIRPAKVTIVTASSGQINRSYPATVLPSRELELSFRVSGPLIELNAAASSEVMAGDVIARIDPRDFENQIAQLESQRDQAVAQLQALQSGARAEEISALEAAVESAQAQVDQAADNLTRTRQLVDRGVAAEAQLEAAQADFRVAEAALRSQQEQLRIGQVGGRPEEIAQAEAALAGIEAQIKVAEDALSDATLIAPFDGVIGRRDVENFSLVQAGQGIALLQGLNVVHLAFDVPGPDVTALTRNGPSAIENKAFFDAFPGQVFDAEVVEFSVQADSATQTYRGRVAVEVPEGSFILPGMVATVTATTDGGDASVDAPVAAIAADPNGDAFVWVVDEAGLVSARPVTLGEASGDIVSVTEGLGDGEMVVSAGINQISDGMTVRPITEVGN